MTDLTDPVPVDIPATPSEPVWRAELPAETPPPRISSDGAGGSQSERARPLIRIRAGSERSAPRDRSPLSTAWPHR